MIWISFIVITLAWLIFASITDLKTREVPDWLNYSLIAIGLGGRGIYSIIQKDSSYIFYGVIGLLIFFVFSNVMYFTKQWGGGDAKLLMGLGAMFGNYEGINLFNPILNMPFLAILVLNILLAGAIYGIFYIIYLAIKNKENFWKEFTSQPHKELLIGLAIGIIILAASFLIQGFESDILLVVGFLTIVSVVIYTTSRTVEKSCMEKEIKLEKLTEGDWLAKDVRINNKIICNSIHKANNFVIQKRKNKLKNYLDTKIKFLSKKTRKQILEHLLPYAKTYTNLGITKDDIQRLKKYKVKKVTIKDGIPFVPSFLFGFILSITLGNLFMAFFKAFAF